MGLAFRIMVFVFLFNIAAGILTTALGDKLISDVSYNQDSADLGFSGEVAAPGAETQSGWWDKFIDFLRVGFLQKAQALLDRYFYGITNIFQNTGVLHPSYVVFFNSAITVIYAIGIIDLFTGRRVTG
jgi:hypothetical protein